MRKITEIYKEYKIMPNLELHQLRVAAVAKQICESLDIDIDKNEIIQACLLHDIGNIIKFDLEYFPEFLQPKGLVYWENIKREYISKYGEDEHIASMIIAKEIGLSEIVINYINAVDIADSVINEDNKNFVHKLCLYADTRVGPFGVVSLEDRFIDGEKRYDKHPKKITYEARIKHEECLRIIEKQIFSHSNMKPEDINDESIAESLETLKNFEI